MSNSLDDLLAGGGKSAKFEAAGDTITGKVVAVDVRQRTNITTNEPLTWDDGSPQLQAVITLDTDQRDPEVDGDDGKRNVYVKMWGEQKKALAQAGREAGGNPAPGDTFTATMTGFGAKKNPAFSPPKLFTYKIVKGSPLDAPMAQSAVAQAQAPATPAAQPAAPQAAVAAPAPDVEEQVTKLIGLGLTDEQIAQALGDWAKPIATQKRLQAAASASGGF